MHRTEEFERRRHNLSIIDMAQYLHSVKIGSSEYYSNQNIEDYLFCLHEAFINWKPISYSVQSWKDFDENIKNLILIVLKEYNYDIKNS